MNHESLESLLRILLSEVGEKRFERAALRVLSKNSQSPLDKSVPLKVPREIDHTKALQSLRDRAAHHSYKELELIRLGEAFLQGTFLPNMREVHRFLRDFGIDPTNLTSRAKALNKLLMVLEDRSRAELQEMIKLEGESTRSSLAIISDEILGKPRER